MEVAAYGLADAEAQVEKEIRAAWPGARVEVTEVARTGEGRIVEGFAVAYRVRGSVAVSAGGEEGEEEARKAALRWLRARFEGTRHARIAWERG